VDRNRRIGTNTDRWKHPLRNVQVGSLVPDHLLQSTSVQLGVLQTGRRRSLDVPDAGCASKASLV